jgi:AcrR family transcriptional regulator
MSEAAANTDPVGKREKTKVANRQAILAAARKVFAELGYEAATVRDIIRNTDLASGTFYNYFKSKEEVFDALADDGARRFRPILRSARENAKSFEDYLHSAFVAYFHFIVQDNQIEGRPIMERRPHVIRMDTPEMTAVYQEVRQSLDDAIAHGDAPRVDSDYLACACIGIAQEVGSAMLLRSPPDIEAAADFATGLILKGLVGAARKG